KIQNSFENILLKFRDQMVPLKMAEVDTLKYENNRLLSTVQNLEARLNKISEKLDKAAKAKLKITRPSTKKKAKKKAKKTGKKKIKKNVKKATSGSKIQKKKAKKKPIATRAKRKIRKKK